MKSLWAAIFLATTPMVGGNSDGGSKPPAVQADPEAEIWKKVSEVEKEFKDRKISVKDISIYRSVRNPGARLIVVTLQDGQVKVLMVMWARATATDPPQWVNFDVFLR